MSTRNVWFGIISFLFPKLDIKVARDQGFFTIFGRKKFIRVVGRNLKHRMDRYRMIHLEPEIQRQLLRTIRAYQKPLARWEIIFEALSYYRYISFEIAWFLFALTGTVILKWVYLDQTITASSFWRGLAFRDPQVVILVSLITFLVIRLLGRSMDILSGWISFTTRVFVLIFILAVASFTLLKFIQISPIHTFTFFLVFSLIGSLLGLIIIGLISIIVDTLIILISNQRVDSRNPDGIFVHIMIMILSEFELVMENRNKIDFKSWVQSKLELAARVLEKHYYKYMQSKDSAIDRWSSKSIREIAAAVRDLEKLIILPRHYTNKIFIDAITSMLIKAASGHWGDLPRMSIEVTPVKKSWIGYAMDVLRVIFIGGAPLALLLVTQNFGMRLQDPLQDYALIGAILWALFTAVMTFDPQFLVKINALREMSSMLPKQ